ncbi:hemolysin family protein [Rubeoparvulum massiliense]|uniref:hemolysin family protein n=1 Tax=Rubeoparvulum massiliense TaxID=1631346 RepID=UPI00065E6569|nr:hemolysin family protein [Rubeoparvulum massiliense]
MILVNLLLVILLIAFTAFFVATEFAIVKVRRTRIDQLVAEGNKKAVSAKRVVTHLDEFLSACQLGITITSLGLGWLGEPTFQRILQPIFEKLHVAEPVSSVVSFIIAFALITFIHVVLGELAPKTLAIQSAERVALAVARPLILFYKVMYPFIWVLNSAARGTARLFGAQPISDHEMAHTEEELRIILSESYKSGEINQSEFRYVNNIFEFDDRIAKEIMVPRTEMVTIPKEATIEDLLKIVKESNFTRYPISDGDKDNIIGYINLKEVYADLLHHRQSPSVITPYVKPVLLAIETIPIHDLLVQMQKKREHIAILLDEYGGTAGLVTIEDILEEIVGEIRDEFDEDEAPLIQKIAEQHYILDGMVLIEDVNDLLGIHIDEEEVDTIGGWMLTNQITIQVGETLSFDSYEFKVLAMDGHHIERIEVRKVQG